MAKEPVTTARKAPGNAEIEGHHPDENRDNKEVANEVNLGESRDVVDKRLEKISAGNEEGHAKNMQAIEDAHKDNEGDDVKPAAGLGREDNGNTPRINKDGSKTWLPPGVAGAAR